MILFPFQRNNNGSNYNISPEENIIGQIFTWIIKSCVVYRTYFLPAENNNSTYGMEACIFALFISKWIYPFNIIWDKKY